jgi:6-pyruvoyl-tetrahydropterin synthase
MILETATMHLNHVTVLDHGYIGDDGMVYGGSFHPSFLVEGDVDPVEKVVIDFSTVKKKVKALIDDNETGFDHKLWIMEGYSNCKYMIKQDQIWIKSNRLELDLPRNAVKIFKCDSHSTFNVGQALELYVEEAMQDSHPGTRITCYNSTTPHVINDADVSMFTYVHGLKDSTSWGCQNNSHGHLSFVQVIGDTISSNTDELKKVENLIANTLDRTVFINSENITENTDEQLTIEYYTEARGWFIATYYKTEDTKIIILNTETTIEYLVEYVADRFARELSQCGAATIMVSEGLSKGAYKKL